MVLVDVDHLDARTLAAKRKRIAALDRLGVVAGALPVAVVKLRRADQGVKPRRIDLVYQALAHDLDVVAELLTEIRDAPFDSGKGPQDHRLIRWILAQRRWKAFADRRHDWGAEVVLVAILVL